MALVFLFVFGVANFALHKAVLESGHPILMQLPAFFRGNRWMSLFVEFLLLLGTMLLAEQGNLAWVWGYGLYSVMNGLSAWLILSGRI